MSHKNTALLQNKISEVEKFIETVLTKPMTAYVKRKILDELQRYKARLIAAYGDEAPPSVRTAKTPPAGLQ